MKNRLFYEYIEELHPGSFDLLLRLFSPTLIKELVIDVVRAQDRVPDGEKRAIVADVMRVVIGMVSVIASKWNDPEQGPGELVAAVSLDRLHQAEAIPKEGCREVNLLAENHNSNGCWQQIAEDELKRVGMLACGPDGDFVLVVDLVNVRINQLVMKHTVAHCESQILTEHAE